MVSDNDWWWLMEFKMLWQSNMAIDNPFCFMKMVCFNGKIIELNGGFPMARFDYGRAKFETTLKPLWNLRHTQQSLIQLNHLRNLIQHLFASIVADTILSRFSLNKFGKCHDIMTRVPRHDVGSPQSRDAAESLNGHVSGCGPIESLTFSWLKSELPKVAWLNLHFVTLVKYKSVLVKFSIIVGEISVGEISMFI